MKTVEEPYCYALLSPSFNPKISARCGKGTCKYYNKQNKISGCYHFDDRRKCSKSLKQRKQSANTSKKKSDINWWY